MDHNATLEDVEDTVNIKAEKYVDDMTLFHPIERSTAALIEPDGTELVRAVESERALRKIEDTCERKGLKINEKKTQILALSSVRANKRNAWVGLNDGSQIMGGDTLKLLGFQ